MSPEAVTEWWLMRFARAWAEAVMEESPVSVADLDQRFIEFMRGKKLSNGPYAPTEPRLLGKVQRISIGSVTDITVEQWKFDSPDVQLLWECWQDGHNNGAADAY